ncbi:uncharacterized protein EV420DRAFT_155319 [Desarmillaria tabescens]|uniref:MYND-type domain-containing protein n=1 Tax=Armillaria tabescens TaxID=1929756 RepID=A0AA39MLK8_ARMTA|nr:uncharacterized protein EV420DRAFT_155319 [Desarmillaria tabescens]KAK0437930.1 hypothetical protein EV420DRAFT_155319 [Desarmillaria tabescens]
MECMYMCLLYITRIMQDGHSYIHQLLGYNILLYMFKALRNLHTYPELADQRYKELKTTIAVHIVNILNNVICHFSYASILKRSKKAISKIQRQHADGFLDPKDLSLKDVYETWSQFVTIASYRNNIWSTIPDLFCGNSECPGASAGMFMACSGCRSTQYCSRTCQKDDWTSGAHRSLCIEIKQLRSDGAPLPMSSSDQKALENLNSQYVKYYRQEPSEWDALLEEYIAKNGEPNPFWPLVVALDYRALDVNPQILLESSERRVKNLEIVAQAREGRGIFVYWTIPDGYHLVEKGELVVL